MLMAHIHYGKAKTNGPIVVNLVPTAQDNTTTGTGAIAGLPILANPVSGTVNFTSTFTSADFQSKFAGKKYLQLEKAAAKGLLYVNIHTVAYEGGIVRGQLVPASAINGGKGCKKRCNTMARSCKKMCKTNSEKKECKNQCLATKMSCLGWCK